MDLSRWVPRAFPRPSWPLNPPLYPVWPPNPRVVVARGMLGRASPLVVRGLSLLPRLVRMPLLRRLVRLRRGLLMWRLIGAR